jgi:hypothetical protein
MTPRLGAAIVGRALSDVRSGGAVLAVVKRARATLAALLPRFRCGLPACTLRPRALGEREQADDSCETSKHQPHAPRMRCRTQPVKFMGLLVRNAPP